MTATQPQRALARISEQRAAARAMLRYALLVGAGMVLLVVLLAGCGATPLPPAAPSTIAPTTPPAPTTSAPPTTVVPTEPPAGTTGGRADGNGGGAAPKAPTSAPRADGRPPTPIWPVSDTASARRLQRDVDGGRQPWLLDPVEVATSYAGSELGYRNPGVFPLGGGRVDVQDGRSPARATITLAQTATRGDGGIWVVTGVQRR